MKRVHTGYYDDNNNPIFVGDQLRNHFGYDVIVVVDKGGSFYCKLVCDEDNSCKNLPYSLNKGKGYKIVNMNGIDIDKILKKHNWKSLRFGKEAMKIAIKEIVEAVVDKCAEEAKTEDMGGVVIDHDGDSVWSSHEVIDKESILNVKKMINY